MMHIGCRGSHVIRNVTISSSATSVSSVLRKPQRRYLKSMRLRGIYLKNGAGLARARLDWEREKRNSLRAALIREYEKKERSKWVRNVRRIEQSFSQDTAKEHESSKCSPLSPRPIDSQFSYKENVQCGIFWDIENVWNEYSGYPL